jgi:gluconolactonase
MLIDGEILPFATHYGSKRLNSPNDLYMTATGDLYFTDPSYGMSRVYARVHRINACASGLNQRDVDPARELAFNGVYLLNKTAIGVRLWLCHHLNLPPDK